MRSSRPVQLRERGQVVTVMQRTLWIMTLAVGFPALVVELFTLTARPLLGVLILIAAMAALLYSAAGFAKAREYLDQLSRYWWTTRAALARIVRDKQYAINK